MIAIPERVCWIANEWYWRIQERASVLTLEATLRDFVRPMLRLLGPEHAASVDVDGDALAVTIAEQPARIALTAHANDRVILNHVIGDLNRLLASARVDLAFALLVPRRYELCGALLEPRELDALFGDPALLVPSSRRSWNAL